ncbi:hypothetical protein NKG05_29565 [Oerskovia sp. M15]
MVGPQAVLTDADRRRLTSRARERGNLLVAAQPGPGRTSSSRSARARGRAWTRGRVPAQAPADGPARRAIRRLARHRAPGRAAAARSVVKNPRQVEKPRPDSGSSDERRGHGHAHSGPVGAGLAGDRRDGRCPDPRPRADGHARRSPRPRGLGHRRAQGVRRGCDAVGRRSAVPRSSSSTRTTPATRASSSPSPSPPRRSSRASRSRARPAAPALGRPARYHGTEDRLAQVLVERVAQDTGHESQVGVADGILAAVLGLGPRSSCPRGPRAPTSPHGRWASWRTSSW